MVLVWRIVTGSETRLRVGVVIVALVECVGGHLVVKVGKRDGLNAAGAAENALFRAVAR